MNHLSQWQIINSAAPQFRDCPAKLLGYWCPIASTQSKAVAIAGRSHLEIQGLHFYRGTSTNATAAFTEAVKTVLTIGAQLPDWQYLDFGGGFGYPYHHGAAVFDWDLFGQVLSRKSAGPYHLPNANLVKRNLSLSQRLWGRLRLQIRYLLMR
jgi:hypothetical protein